jgi:hypothetical protein
LAAACWHYALFLLVFFYASRFLNENYLGYILAFLADRDAGWRQGLMRTKKNRRGCIPSPVLRTSCT